MFPQSSGVAAMLNNPHREGNTEEQQLQEYKLL